jgi:hypothetical protein
MRDLLMTPMMPGSADVRDPEQAAVGRNTELSEIDSIRFCVPLLMQGAWSAAMFVLLTYLITNYQQVPTFWRALSRIVETCGKVWQENGSGLWQDKASPHDTWGSAVGAGRDQQEWRRCDARGVPRRDRYGAGRGAVGYPDPGGISCGDKTITNSRGHFAINRYI